MHPKRTARRLLPWAFVLTLGMVATLTGRGQPPEPKNAPPVLIDAKTGALIVPIGGVVTFDAKLPVPPTDILISNEAVLTVQLDPSDPTQKRLILRGRAGGVSQITVVMKDRPPLKYDVVVQPDLTLLRNLIKRTVPTSNVDVQPGFGNVVILSGYVTSPQDADIIARLANSAVGGTANNVINAIQVGGVQQVQIDVVVASVDRSQLRARGFDFFLPGGGNGTSFASLISGLLGVQQSAAGGGGAGGTTTTNATFNGAANLQLAVTPSKFFGALQALKTEGVAKFLAEPRVVTQSGRVAFFRAGGQQAILSGTSGITGPGVQLVPFGTELEVVPIVYGNNMIWLDINPRITAVSQALGITVGGASSPGFTEQTVRSTVLLESGQTFAIGGLIQTTVQASANKVPVLGELPYAGTLFSSLNYQTRESELVILVTPRLVAPLDQCQAPKRLPGQETRTPDDYELFLENVLEAPRGQRKVWNGKCYNAPYKCGPTVNQFPCAGGICTGPMGACLPGAGCAAPGALGVPGAAAVPPVLPGAVPQPIPPLPPSGGGASAPADAGATSAAATTAEPPVILPAVPGTPVGLPAGGTGEPVVLPPLPPVGGSPPR
jgi:pilus assembly protein CpaC